MEKQYSVPKRWLNFLMALLVFLGLFLASLYNYLLFHSLGELFSIVVASGIFMIAWNSRRFIENNYFLFISIAYLFVAGLDLVHTLSYKGMEVFQGYETNLPTQLWIAARYVESLSLLIAPFYLRRRMNSHHVFLGFSVATFLLLASIFYWNIFPVCFVEGEGLTSFKKISEYTISLILLGSIGVLLANRKEFDQSVLKWLVWSIILTIASELALTLYIHAYGLPNLIGHFLKILSFYLIYKALVETGLSQPYSLLFRNLKRSEEALRESESKYRSLFSNMANGFAYHKVLLDDHGKAIDYVFLEVNGAFEKMTGLRGENVIGRRATGVLPGIEHDPTDWIEAYGKVAHTGEPLRLENYSGALKKWYSVSAYSPEKGYFATVFEDITELKQMEEELRRSRDELEIRVQERTTEISKAYRKLEEQSRILEAFFTSTITPLVFLDKDFNFIRVNEAYAKACQRDASEFPGHNHFEFYPSDTRVIFEEVVRTKTPYQAVARPFLFPDHPEWGETYWDWTLTPISSNPDEVEFLVFSLNDVTERTQAQKAQAWLTAILEATSDFVGVADPDGQVLYLNRSARRTLGINKEEDLSNIGILDTHPERVRSIVSNEGIPVAIREGIWSGETAFLTREGREIPVSQVILSHKSSNGEIQYFSTIARDITEQKEEERRMTIRNALLELFAKKTSREEYLDAVVNLFQQWSRCRCVGIRVLDRHGDIPYEAYVGFSPEFWESENWLSIREHQCACIRVILGELDPQEACVVTPGGSFCCGNTARFIENLSEAEKIRYRGVCVRYGFLSVAIVPIRYHEKIIGAVHLADEMENNVSFKVLEFIESVTPLIGEAVMRFNLEKEVKESERRLRFLSSELLRVQENERKRIAREIHDSIGQTLASIKFGLESKLSQMGQNKIPPGISLESIISLAQNGIEESRRIQMDLRPSILDDLGILATLGWFTREYEKVYSRIAVERQIHIQEKEVPDRLKIVLFRVIQEAMNNIAKHSKADFVRLSLAKVEDRINLTIEDNGVGFNPENIKQGLGLTSMRERTELSEGTFEIESILGNGTTLRASWAL